MDLDSVADLVHLHQPGVSWPRRPRSPSEGGRHANLQKLDRRVTTVHDTLKFRFRYGTASADPIWVQCFSERAQDGLRFDVKSVGKESGEAVEIPLCKFTGLADGSRPQEGGRFTWMDFAVSGSTGPVYSDDIERVEVQKMMPGGGSTEPSRR